MLPDATLHNRDLLKHVSVVAGIRGGAPSGVFVVPTLSTLGSLAGDLSGETLANDERVAGFISDEWHQNLCQCWHLGGPGRLDCAIEATRLLHRAGVPILLGTDAQVSESLARHTAHCISIHGQLRLLVQAGFTPVVALRAATSLPAAMLDLIDRGRIREGLQADLVLVNGNPTAHIEDSLPIDKVWRRGELLDRSRKFARAVSDVPIRISID